MSDRITDARTLKPGDVVMVAVELRDRRTGGTYWWKRFCAVLAKPTTRLNAVVVTLKQEIDDKDVRDIRFDKDVVTLVEESAWPQGVIAMRMKWIMKGLIKLEGAD